ncbi:MAG: glycoside hydrolase family 75 protein [Chthoniobacter sp.]|uniref:glycoside hydrolase family 75 protein n=1 Tax=Chthoniobacter sp. TaxID=2510640 RepID=UPI0032AA6F01
MRVSRIAQFVGLGLVSLLVLTGCPQPPEPPPSTPTPTPLPAGPTPTPPPYVPNKKLDVGKMFNGMQYRVTLETEHGTTATRDRNELGSYAAELTVKVKVPKPHHDLDEIKRLNESLPEILPGLPDLLESSRVSPSFDNLYRLKCAALQASLMRLDNLLTRHNFFDCETILELQHAKTSRRALFIQADMDVDTDGSDPDRVPEVDGASPTFQPFTSYRWGRKTTNPSSFVAPREAKIKTYEAELANGNPTAARRENLKTALADLRTEISDLKKYSFLIGADDPFIVLPGSLFGKNKGAFAPAVGDYCVVAYLKTLYPAVVGDVGPGNLIGEASLRICKEVNVKSNSENRPISELKVTYLVFPGTAEKFDTPNLAHWRDRCEKLLDEIGGHKGNLFTWEDLTKPKATPTPTTPVPSTPSPATPAPSTPTASPRPATPAPTSPTPATPKPAPKDQ